MGFNKKKFEAALALKGMLHKDLAEAMGLGRSTLSVKVANNGAFTRKDINKLIEIFGKDVALDFLYD